MILDEVRVHFVENYRNVVMYYCKWLDIVVGGLETDFVGARFTMRIETRGR